MERHLGRRLLFIERNHPHNEAVHHINGSKSDNRIENLQLMTYALHCAIHKMGRRSCSLADCNNKHCAAGLCKKHFKYYLRHGLETPETSKPSNSRGKTKGRLCSEPGCSNKHYAKDLCNKHYQRTILKPGRVRPVGR